MNINKLIGLAAEIRAYLQNSNNDEFSRTLQKITSAFEKLTPAACDAVIQLAQNDNIKIKTSTKPQGTYLFIGDHWHLHTHTDGNYHLRENGHSLSSRSIYKISKDRLVKCEIEFNTRKFFMRYDLGTYPVTSEQKELYDTYRALYVAQCTSNKLYQTDVSEWVKKIAPAKKMSSRSENIRIPALVREAYQIEFDDFSSSQDSQPDIVKAATTVCSSDKPSPKKKRRSSKKKRKVVPVEVAASIEKVEPVVESVVELIPAPIPVPAPAPIPTPDSYYSYLNKAACRFFNGVSSFINNSPTAASLREFEDAYKSR